MENKEIQRSRATEIDDSDVIDAEVDKQSPNGDAPSKTLAEIRAERAYIMRTKRDETYSVYKAFGVSEDEINALSDDEISEYADDRETMDYVRSLNENQRTAISGLLAIKRCKPHFGVI